MTRLVPSLALACSLLAFGCSSSSDDASGGASIGATGATVEGFLFQGSPVVFVDDPSHAPAGDTAVAGAEVRAMDIDGEVIGTATSGSNGAFRISNLPTGYTELEARLDPASAVPDASAVVTAVTGQTAKVNPVFPVSRQDATALALAGVGSQAMVTATMQPLAPGLRVTPSGFTPAPVPERITVGSEWLFLVDPTPRAEFAHAVEYVFVDATTAQVSRLTGVRSPPRVQGQALWASERQVLKFRGLDPGDPALPTPAEAEIVATAEVVQLPAPAVLKAAPWISLPVTVADADSQAPIRQKHNTDPASIFVLVLQASPDTYKVADVKRVVDLFVTAGQVPFTSNVRIVRSYDHSDTSFSESAFVRALNELNAAIQARFDQGLHSTLVVYITSHGGDENFEYFLNRNGNLRAAVFADQLNLPSTRACRVRVVLQFCEALEFGDKLAAEFNELAPPDRHDYAIYSASGHDQPAYADKYIPGLTELGLVDPGTEFTKAIVKHAQVLNGDLTNLLDLTRTTNLRQEVDGLSGSPSAIVNQNNPRWCDGGGPFPGTNRAPTANAGIDQHATAGNEVRLDASESTDPDGDALNYEWEVVSYPDGGLPVLDDVVSPTPTFTPTRAGTYEFRVIVADGKGETATDSVIITVADAPSQTFADPFAPVPPGAVAWKVVNPEISYELGPYALPGALPNGHPVVHPLADIAPAFWGSGEHCAFVHLHGEFRGNPDPAPNRETNPLSACGHGGLVYLFP